MILPLAVAACLGDEGIEGPACLDGDPAEERYGTDCLCCHEEFGIAGSVDREGPPVERIVVTDRGGRSAVMSPNPYGNFFRHIQLEGPLDVAVYGPDGSVLRMDRPASDGACNRCHRPGGVALRITGP